MFFENFSKSSSTVKHIYLEAIYKDLTHYFIKKYFTLIRFSEDFNQYKRVGLKAEKYGGREM